MTEISFNRGEWSELYAALHLLSEPYVKLIDHTISIINDSTYKVKKVIFDVATPVGPTEITYSIVKDDIIITIQDDDENALFITQDEIGKYKNKLLQSIQGNDSKKGSFHIGSIDEFLDRFSQGYVLKSKTSNKSDISLLCHDNIENNDKLLSYSIKSSLGSPATILNASNNTNFVYQVLNFDDKKMEIVNNVNTKTKLIDRINKIHELDGKIFFCKTASDTLNCNLKIIDRYMPRYIGKTLLYSYIHNNKNLKEIFMEANRFINKQAALNKLADFLSCASFGFFPGSVWDGEFSVNGGLINVEQNGQVGILDMVYHTDEIREYLVNESRLDSPSSSRYHMLEIYKENEKYYFTLNLQVRFKH